MLKIHLISVGKNKESWLSDALDLYIKRLKPTMEITCTWARDDAHLIALSKNEKNVIGLDPNGKMMDSEEFSGWLYQQSRFCFVIGGAEGLPPELKQNPLISLSKMTMTHQIARLFLVEQLYRASEIHKGSPYHK